MWDLLGENGFLHLIEGKMARARTRARAPNPNPFFDFTAWWRYFSGQSTGGVDDKNTQKCF